MTSIINRRQLSIICINRATTIKWCQQAGLLLGSQRCEVHQCEMKFDDKNLGRYRCRKGECRGKKPVYIAEGTWFSGRYIKSPSPKLIPSADVRLSPESVLSLLYSFAMDESYEDARREAIDIDDEGIPSEKRLSDNTISDWFNYYREVIIDRFMKSQESLGKIGGPNIVVQIDESKFGRRKFNKVFPLIIGVVRAYLNC